MNDEDDNEWADYESGPFCRHWGDPSDCEEECEGCKHKCCHHNYSNDDTSCMESGCPCQKWLPEVTW